MVTKTILLIILSSLLFAGYNFTLGASSLSLVQAPPPPPPTPPDEPPWYLQLLQSIADSLGAAGEQIGNWLDEVLSTLQDSIAQAIQQFLQGLIDQFVQVVTQTFQNLLNQTCGVVLLLPAGAIAGIWLISRKRSPSS
jgi:hypothetical protein